MKILFLSPSTYMSPRFKDVIFAPRDLAITLVNGLIEGGHEVVFATAPDVPTKATIFPGDINLLELNESAQQLKELSEAEKIHKFNLIKRDYEIDLITRAYQSLRTLKPDVVHAYHKDMLHYFHDFAGSTPVIYTLHDPLPETGTFSYQLFSKFSFHNYISISDAQRRSKLSLKFIDTIYHGLDLNCFFFAQKPTDNLLFMGRLVKEKGLHTAIEASLASNRRLLIGTQLPDKKHENDYFINRIKPFLQHPLIDNPGIVQAEQKVALYGQVTALLFPIEWEEPFGMVMIEAMACGTPVIAYNRGSVAEIIKDGVTGFIIDPDNEDRPGKGSWVIKKQGMEGFIEAINRLSEIDRAACRKHVEEHFTVKKMVEGYERVYEKILQTKS